MMQQLDLFGLPPQPPTVKQPVPGAPEQEDGAPPAPGAPLATSEALPVKGKKRGRKSLKELSGDPHVIQELEKLTLDKQYYSISEVAGMFRVNTSLIRYWENEFDILQPKKTGKATASSARKISNT